MLVVPYPILSTRELVHAHWHMPHIHYAQIWINHPQWGHTPYIWYTELNGVYPLSLITITEFTTGEILFFPTDLHYE